MDKFKCQSAYNTYSEQMDINNQNYGRHLPHSQKSASLCLGIFWFIVDIFSIYWFIFQKVTKDNHFSYLKLSKHKYIIFKRTQKIRLPTKRPGFEKKKSYYLTNTNNRANFNRNKIESHITFLITKLKLFLFWFSFAGKMFIY